MVCRKVRWTSMHSSGLIDGAHSKWMLRLVPAQALLMLLQAPASTTAGANFSVVHTAWSG